VIEPEPLQQTDRTYVLWRRRKLSYFSGCDYFRLASHPRVIAALAEGLKRYGLSVAASRLTTGNHRLYRELEKRLGRLFQTESALLVPSGYVANLAVAQALSGQFSHALEDEAAHPSLGDAASMLECPVLKFGHRSPADLASAVRRCGPGSKLILLTDGMFSRDGSVAPLKEYLNVLPKDAALLVDDAHGAGVLGAHGRGSPEHTGVNQRRLIQTITLSKAIGTYGGAILSSESLRRKVLQGSRLFIGSTPLPLPVANAALQSLKILGKGKGLRSRLVRNTHFVRSALRRGGLSLLETPGPIVALRPKHVAAVAEMKLRLLAADIYPPFVQYPGGPVSGYFRFVISSEHNREQLDNLVEILSRTHHLLTPEL
jgi:7-keto-8-aminopelargonate synthetase-like enzyme